MTGVRRLRSVVLTPAAVVVRCELRDGAGGDVLASLQAAADGGSVAWYPGINSVPAGVQFTQSIHVTLSGAGATATVEYT